MINILFIGPLPPPYSGPEQGMAYFLQSDLRNKFNISFLKTNVRSSNVEKGKIDFTIFKAFFRFFYRLVRILFRERPRLVYYPITATRTGWLGRDIWTIALSRLFGAKVVIHLRAGHFRINYENITRFEKLLIRRIFKTVDLALVQAESLKKQFDGILPPHKIEVLYNAIDSSLYKNDDPKSFSKNKILFLGFLSFSKGFCDLLEVIPRISESFPDIKFIFCGEKFKNERNVFNNQITGEALRLTDPDEVFEKYIKNRYENNVIFPGVVFGEEKIEFLKDCNFLILPSYSEGFSMAVLEAMCMGKPVVCTPVGALAEVVEDGVNGLLVQPGDLDGIEEAIVRLLTDKVMRHKISSYNNSYVRMNFDIDIISKKMEEKFFEILKSKK